MPSRISVHHVINVILHHFLAFRDSFIASVLSPEVNALLTFSACMIAGIPVGQNIRIDTIAHARWLLISFVLISSLFFPFCFVLSYCFTPKDGEDSRLWAQLHVTTNSSTAADSYAGTGHDTANFVRNPCKALPSLSITSYVSLRVAVGCLARTVCRGRTLHAAARVAPGGLAVPIHLDRTLNPPQMVAVRRLPMAVGLLGHLDTPGAVSKRRLAVPVRRVRSLNPPERITPGSRAGAIRRHRPLQPPGGVPVCYLSTWVASHRTLHPSLSVPISRLPEPVRFIRPGYPALPVTIDRLPGSIRVNRPLSATRRIIIRRRSSDERKSRTGGKKKPFRVHTRNLSGRRRAVRAWRSMSEPDRVRTNRLFGRFLRRLRVLGRCLFRLDLQAFSHKVGIGGGWQCRRHWPDLGR